MPKPVLFRLTNNLNIGGVQKRISSILPMITDEFEPHVTTYRDKGFFFDRLPKKEIPTHFLPIQGKLHLPSIFRLARFWRQHNTSIVHTHSLGANIPGILAAAMAQVPVRIAQVHRKNLHWYARTVLQRRKQIALEALVHRLFTDKVLFVSHESLEYFQEHTRLPNSKLHVLHNGIDFPDASITPHQARAQKKLPQDATIVGFVGRLSKGKGIDYFLKTAQQALQDNPHLVFLIIGDGPSRRSQEEKVKASGLGSNILFAGEQSDMENWYPTLDMLFFTSEPEAEGMPGVVLEACAHNLPILARYSAPIAEIQQYYSRIAFSNEGKNPSIQIEKTLTIPQSNLKQFESEFSIDSMAERTKKLYKNSLRKKYMTLKNYKK